MDEKLHPLFCVDVITYPCLSLFVRSRKVTKPRDWYFKLSYRFEIWQAHRQHCCRSACQISERSDNSKYKSRGFETLRDLTERRLFGYWDGAWSLAYLYHWQPTTKYSVHVWLVKKYIMYICWKMILLLQLLLLRSIMRPILGKRKLNHHYYCYCYDLWRNQYSKMHDDQQDGCDLVRQWGHLKSCVVVNSLRPNDAYMRQ